MYPPKVQNGKKEEFVNFTFKRRRSTLLPRLSAVALTALAFVACAGDPISAPTQKTRSPQNDLINDLLPGTVSDLAVASVTDSGVVLSFTEVENGLGLPASYVVRFATPPIVWDAATNVTQGSCTVPVAGITIGAKRTCEVRGLTPATDYEFQMVAFRGILDLSPVFGGLSDVVSGTTASQPPPPPAQPGTVTDLAVASVADSSVTLSFTEVNDGAGQPASYEIRWAAGTLSWDSAHDVDQGSCHVPVAGSAIGARRSCTVLGLSPSTNYQFQMVAFRGTLHDDAVLGERSNVASGTTTSSPIPSSPPPLPPPPPPGPGVVFQSDWSGATGTAATAVRDGNRWENYWEFNNGTGVQLLSVVAGGPAGYANALKVVQRGPTYSAALQQDDVLPASTDYYVRYYMRNDDTSPAGDHVVTPDIYSYSNLTYMRKFSGSSDYQMVISLYGCGYTYPIGHWSASRRLSKGVWYRFEYFVHFVDPTHVQVHPRVYDASGTQILTDADFLQSDYGSQTWNGRNDWTFASYYAAGYSFCVDPASLTHFAVGNNGQQGSVDTGLSWYFAGIQIRTDGWPGP